jgi:predicted LPLAT superfamily acyltransferase
MKYNALIKSINPESDVNLIHVNQIKPEISILLKSKIDQGELVFVAGDRTSAEHTQRDVSVSFLGDIARFPHGPAVLGHILECPVYFFFCLKIQNSYHLHFEKYSERLVLARKTRQQQIEHCMSSFAKRLELFTLHHPYQWFNFYDFWEQ